MSAIRKRAIEILTHPELHSPLDVHNAIIDLRRNAEIGDELLLTRYLDYDDDMAVAAALYGLVKIFDKGVDLLPLIMNLARGDNRDTGEMPIQTQAIESLCDFARSRPELVSILIDIGSERSTPEAPRARSWRCLASLFNVEWSPEYTEIMIRDPECDDAEVVRDLITTAAQDRNFQPYPK